ncbi:MAG: TraR/DksA C4-type zinc finger protein [Pseudonocardia sp.]|nr:TraR/DksA C4-type zinc finger protein [Pseudonocardia sp.]
MTRPHAVHAVGNAATAPRPEPLLGVRAMLVRQRDFRREQLEAHERRDTTSATGAALDPTCEVNALVAAGARRALADIELALSRLATGRYGRCRICDTDIPLALLQAIPQTTVCLSCLQSIDHSGGSDDRTPAVGSARPRHAPGYRR